MTTSSVPQTGQLSFLGVNYLQAPLNSKHFLKSYEIFESFEGPEYSLETPDLIKGNRAPVGMGG